jgi:predicted DNA-binding antitoxin AbrB/MazE fold protein
MNLATEIGEEVFGSAKRGHGVLEQPGHRRAARLGGERLAGERKPRERVEYGGEVESLCAEESLELGHVHHPHLVDELREDRIRWPQGVGLACAGGSDDLLSLDVAYRLLRDPEPGQGEIRRDQLRPPEPEPRHHLNKMPNSVAQPSDRRNGLGERADCFGLRRLVALPVRDGVVGHEELSGGALLVPAKQAADFENLETGRNAPVRHRRRGANFGAMGSVPRTPWAVAAGGDNGPEHWGSRRTIGSREIIMSIVIEAVWEKGVLTPEKRLDLPEKSKVRVTVEPETEDATGWKAMNEFIGLWKDAPRSDYSENHDEYLYSRP